MEQTGRTLTMIQSVSTYWKFNVSLAHRFSANSLVKKSESIIFEYQSIEVNSEASANLLAFIFANVSFVFIEKKK